MIRRCCRSAAALLCGAALFGNASAQSPQMLRKLKSKYDVVWPADCGLMMVNKGGQRVPDWRRKSNGRFGFVDTLGQVVVPPVYDYASRFFNGHAIVGMKNESGKLLSGLIDRTGRVVVPLEWEHLGNVRDGVCVAYNGEGNERVFSLVDTLGNVRRLEYNYCDDFSRGLAQVGVGTYVENEKVPGRKSSGYEFRGKFGYITPDGEPAIPVQFDEAGDFASDGLAPAGMQGKYYVKWGFIDRSGQFVIPCDFYSVGSFQHDRAVVCRVVEDGKLAYGFIDRSGKEVVPCRFDMASPFNFPNAWVGVLNNGEYVYALIDPDGNAVLPFAVVNLQDGGKYGQAAAAIVMEDGSRRYGIVGNDGKIILPFEYDHVSIFSGWDEENNRWQESAMGTKDGVEFSFDISKRDE